MIRGYFMTVFAPDSHPPGEIALSDLSNPKSPVEVDHIENADTDQFREAHLLPVALIDDRQYIAFQTISGIQFCDFTDPLSAEHILFGVRADLSPRCTSRDLADSHQTPAAVKEAAGEALADPHRTGFGLTDHV